MFTPGLPFLLALLRIAAGISLFASGMQKLSWFASSQGLQDKFAQWAAQPANAAVVRYLGYVSQHPAVFSRLVPVGEIGLGLLLIAGLLTPLASLLAFLMVLNFQFASSQMFSLAYLRGQSGLSYALIYPVLFFGRAGTSLGFDGAIARGMRKSASP